MNNDKYLKGFDRSYQHWIMIHTVSIILQGTNNFIVGFYLRHSIYSLLCVFPVEIMRFSLTCFFHDFKIVDVNPNNSALTSKCSSCCESLK